MFYQQTVKSTVRLSGIGLHSGEMVQIQIQPAREGTGIVFVRETQAGPVEIPALARNVSDTCLATVLECDGVKVSTVEHLLGALSGLEIDNARIWVDGPEVPILDGSASPFVRAIIAAGGPARQTQRRKYLAVRKPVRVYDEESSRWASLQPANGFELDCTIDFDHPLIRNQRTEFEVTPASFVTDICGARTFGFAKDVERMRQAGLALGGSLENAVVIDEFSVQNPEGLRFPNEFVRHKLLDAIGDLSLLGAPLLGRYVGVCSGHMLNVRLVKALLARANSYELIEMGTVPPQNRDSRTVPMGLRDALVLS
jgi:UDP-3-O-[3-hydroxymyristoyl] N-acetylglucosamine deacetylase